MRITSNSINRNIQYIINNRYQDMTALQEQIATGKRLMRPSDDPVDVGNDMKLRTQINSLSQYKRNIEDGLAFMSISDSSMVSMNDIVHRMRELLIQANTETISASQRQFIGEEVQQLTRQYISIANTSFRGDYIFAGTNTKTEPYPIKTSTGATSLDRANLKMASYDVSGQLRDPATGKAITNIIPGTFKLEAFGTHYVEGVDYSLDYSTGTLQFTDPFLSANFPTPGTANYDDAPPNSFTVTFDYLSKGQDIYGEDITLQGKIQREIEKGVYGTINITSEELFNNSEAGVNAFDTMIQIGQAMRTDDRPTINQSISELDTMLSTMLSAQSKNGARQNRFQTTLQRNESQFADSTRLQSELEDVEMAEAISKFVLAENVYKAALQSGAKVIQPSLVNFL